MPEGVEHLVVATELKKWVISLDTKNLGFVPFTLNKVLSDSVIAQATFPFNVFNDVYKNLNYKNISTFGKCIFLPSVEGYCLYINLGMTGTLDNKINKYTRIVFNCGDSLLCYNDMRKFGTVCLFDKNHYPKNLSNLLKNGIDWRDPKAPDLFLAKVRNKYFWKNFEIKPALVSQQLIAGIGNIYASEGLFNAGIHPARLIKNLSDEEIIKCIEECQKSMFKSLELGGMTVSTFTAFGKKGLGQKTLNVYRRDATFCLKCKTSTIHKIRQKGRVTYYCPNCQPFI